MFKLTFINYAWILLSEQGYGKACIVYNPGGVLWGEQMRTGKSWEDEHFDVSNSSIVNAGQGLFSRVKIQPGDTIGQYTGIILSDEEVEKPPFVDSHYILWVCKDCNIVGEGPLANYTRYINHHMDPNAHIVTSTRWKKARIEAIETILPGQEVFIDYGHYYWEFFAEQKLA